MKIYPNSVGFCSFSTTVWRREVHEFFEELILWLDGKLNNQRNRTSGLFQKALPLEQRCFNHAHGLMPLGSVANILETTIGSCFDLK
jgi:hypothetical protein